VFSIFAAGYLAFARFLPCSGNSFWLMEVKLS